MDMADVAALVSMILGKAEPTEAADVNGIDWDDEWE